MQSLRTLIHARRRIALLLVVMALAMKAVMPAGYMVQAGPKMLTVTICTGDSLHTAQIAIPMKHTPGKDGQGKEGGQCAFSSLSMAAMGGADAPLLALALAFILLLGFVPTPRLPLRRVQYLLPPLRGPPATA